MDVIDVCEVVCIDMGVVYCDCFGNLYVVIYCVDIYLLIYEVVKDYLLIEFWMSM